MKAEKILKFQYFRIIYHGAETIERYELRRWIGLMIDLELSERIASIKGYPSRLESAAKIENSDYIHLRFVKMIDAFLPNKGYDDQGIEPISLEENEYIAYDLNTLYDIGSQTLMIQINRGSLSPERIAEYINITAHEHKLFSNDEYLTLDPILYKKNIKEESKTYRQVEISFDATQIAFSEKGNNSISNFIKEMNMIGAKTGYIRIGMGRSPKKEGLYKTQMNELIDSVMDNENVNRANITYIDDSDEMYKYDLFDNNILTDTERFETELRTSLDSKAVSFKMQMLMSKRLELLRR